MATLRPTTRSTRAAIGTAAAAFLALFGAVPGCGGDARSEFEEPAIHEARTQVKALCRGADLVFVGKVVKVGPPPPFKAGRIPALQEVTYDVVKVLKGTLGPEEKQVTVKHLVVGGSRNAHEDPEKNELSAKRFSPGAALILMVRRQGGEWVDIHENLGVIPATERNLRAFEALVLKDD